jgi:carbon storage regulator
MDAGYKNFKEESKMLVLGMKPEDYVLIGDDIIVKVIKTSKDDLRLGIDAPKDIPIVRGNVYERDMKKGKTD